VTGRRFSPEELPIDGGRVNARDLAASMAVGRELDALAAAQTVEPSRGFSSRVMAAVAAEPAPQPVLVFGRALAGGRLATMFGAVRDAWRVTTSPGRPTSVRAQSLALVLLAFGSVVGMAGAAVRLFDSHRPDRSTPPTMPAVVVPSPSLDPMVTITLPPTPPTGTPSPRPSTPSKPTATPAPTARPTARPTTRPTATPGGMETPDPTGTGDDGHDGESPSPSSPSSTDNSGSGGD
jgi:hypothetical protein